MLFPHLGPVTPHTRLCAAAFILLIVGFQGLHYALTLALSHRIDKSVVVIALLAYVATMLAPPVRRTTSFIGNLSLAVAACVGLGAYVARAPLKATIAEVVGLYNGTDPTTGAKLVAQTQQFKHTSAGYQMRVPNTWKRKSVSMGLDAFQLPGKERAAAELRPHCESSVVSLGEAVFSELDSYPGTTATCYRWRGDFRACLLKRPMPAEKSTGERWEWLAKSRTYRTTFHLNFLLYDTSSAIQRETLGMIASVTPGTPTIQGAPCLTPVEWVTPFESKDP